MASTLTNERVARIVDAARELVAAHERRAEGHEVPTLAESRAVALVLEAIMDWRGARERST